MYDWMESTLILWQAHLLNGSTLDNQTFDNKKKTENFVRNSEIHSRDKDSNTQTQRSYRIDDNEFASFADSCVVCWN